MIQNLLHSFPHRALELLTRYFRLEVIGAENVPTATRALITPNHSGFLALDGLMLAHQLRRLTGRKPMVLTHHLWFQTSVTATPLEYFGFVEAKKGNGVEGLKNDQTVVLFPEGEGGNFKPSVKAYRLQEFKRGFVRMAIETQTPIIPTLIIGAEETHINLSQLRLPKVFKNLILPVPLNVIPLPARWKIIFLPPIRLPFSPNASHDSELIHETCEEIRDQMQRVLTREVNSRQSIYW